MQTAILKLSIRYVFVLIVVFSTFLRYFIHKNYILHYLQKIAKSFVEQKYCINFARHITRVRVIAY